MASVSASLMADHAVVPADLCLEAPVAIHSLTASDGDSAPRGLDFLLAPNRVHVAGSAG